MTLCHFHTDGSLFWIILLIVGLLALIRYIIPVLIYIVGFAVCPWIFLINALIFALKGKWKEFNEHTHDPDAKFFKRIYF